MARHPIANDPFSIYQASTRRVTIRSSRSLLPWILLNALFLAIIAVAVSSAAQATERLSDLFEVKKPIIGVVNVDVLRGEEGHPGMRALVKDAVRQMKILERAGVDAVLFENGYGTPKLRASQSNIEDLTAVVKAAVQASRGIVVGIEFLLNDPKASLKIAKDGGAKFIRTDYFVDRMTREEWGEMEIDPRGLLEYRKQIGAEDILILTDIQVKYAQMIDPNKTIAQSTRHAKREKSDGIIVTGTATGSAPPPSRVRDSKRAAGELEVIIGSGFSPNNAWQLFQYADAAIVGTSMMNEEAVIIEWKAKRLMKTVRKIRASLDRQ